MRIIFFIFYFFLLCFLFRYFSCVSCCFKISAEIREAEEKEKKEAKTNRWSTVLCNFSFDVKMAVDFLLAANTFDFECDQDKCTRNIFEGKTRKTDLFVFFRRNGERVCDFLPRKKVCLLLQLWGVSWVVFGAVKRTGAH